VIVPPVQIILYSSTIIFALLSCVFWIKSRRLQSRLNSIQSLGKKFIATVPHQIRAPLTAIKGYSSLILEDDFGPVEPELSKALHVISVSSSNLVDITGDYIDLAALSFGNMHYSRETMDLREVLNELVDKFRKNSLHTTIEFNSPVPASYAIQGDKRRMASAFRRLLENAVKYTPQGNVKISIEKKQKHICISISDTGIGIPADFMPSLFKEFTRGDNARVISAVGTGLGLYLTKYTIDAHKGKIWAQSQGVSKGSTFFVELPQA
jgi:signal transduction histidine kinase